MDGFVDSASLYEIVNYLRLGAGSNKWAMQVSKEVSVLFIAAPRIHIMPGFEIDQAPSDTYGHLISRLADKVQILKIAPETQTVALRRTRRWSHDRSDRIRETLQNLYAGTYSNKGEDYSPFADWLGNFFEYNAVEHSLRLKGVFNRTLVPELSKILGVSQSDLSAVWAMSCDVQHLRQVKTLDRESSEDVRIMWDACAVSALLRGRYHDSVAELSDVQVFHHPVRSPVLKTLKESSDVFYQSTEAQQIFACIALNSALRERGTAARMASWVEIVGTARLMLASGELDLGQKPTLEAAERTAVEAARRVGIGAHNKIVSQALELLTILGVGAATSFTLTPWEGFAAATMTASATRIPRIQRLIEAPQHASRRKLRQLASAPPGRLTRTATPRISAQA
jgi:hypothetical protein